MYVGYTKLFKRTTKHNKVNKLLLENNQKGSSKNK